MSENKGRCRQQGCNAGETGICIDSLSREECPNFVIGDFEAVVTDDAVERAPSDPVVKVGFANGLSIGDADRLMRRVPARIISLIGGPAAGKTTIQVVLYELLRREMFSLGFGGSETIRAFEERCHLSRLSSGVSTPDTKRTPRGDAVVFLHLRLAKPQSLACQHILMSDRAGEHFDAVINEPERCISLPDLSRGDVLVFLLDGREFVLPASAARQITRTRKLLLAMKQYDLLERRRSIQLVLTKKDVVEASGEVQACTRRFEEFVEQVKDIVKESCNVSAYQIAARPVEGSLELGAGLEEVVQGWWAPMTDGSVSTIIGGKGARGFDRLMDRFSRGQQ